MGAELLGDLNGHRADTARAAHHENMITNANLSAIRQHVHGGAARECECGGGVEIQSGRNLHQRPRGHSDEFRKSAIARNTQQFAAQTNRFLAALTEFAHATKEIGLHRHGIADIPTRHGTAELFDASSDLATGRAWERDLDRQASGFEPEIEMIESTRHDAHYDFVRCGFGIVQCAEFKFSWRTVTDELESFHTGIVTKRRSDAEKIVTSDSGRDDGVPVDWLAQFS